MSKRAEAIIWKALSDPTRRGILDLLRARPHTTGELSSKFPELTRYGVMKHLGILESANLILIRREGRQRWNSLNAVPIQTIYERWVKPYEAHWASSALKLKSSIEQPKGDNTMSAVAEVATVRVELEVQINASIDRVWEALTNEVESWWRQDFHAYENSAVTMEAFAGGRLVEKSTGGQEGIWYNIQALNPTKSLEMVGHLMPQFGGPATSFLQLNLSENAGTTTLTITDSLVGKLGDQVLQNVKEGWRLLFEEGLKPYIEKENKA